MPETKGVAIWFHAVVLAALTTVIIGCGSAEESMLSDSPNEAANPDVERIIEESIAIAEMDSTSIISDPTPVSPSEAGVAFPRSPEQDRDSMSALGGGTLFLQDGCIRMGVENGRSDIVVWPYGYSLGRQDGEIVILNQNGEAEARIGDKVSVGGGQITQGESGASPEQSERAFDKKRRELGVPDRCLGTLWAAAPGINVTNSR